MYMILKSQMFPDCCNGSLNLRNNRCRPSRDHRNTHRHRYYTIDTMFHDNYIPHHRFGQWRFLRVHNRQQYPLIQILLPSNLPRYSRLRKSNNPLRRDHLDSNRSTRHARHRYDPLRFGRWRVRWIRVLLPNNYRLHIPLHSDRIHHRN